MDAEPDGLAAVQYCVSELIRNVLEHSGSPDGAFVCAHRYTKKKRIESRLQSPIAGRVSPVTSGVRTPRR